MGRSRRIVLSLAFLLSITAAVRAQDASIYAGQNQLAAAEGGHQAALGISLHEVENHVRVSAIQADSPAVRAGIRIGDEIAGIDSVGIHTSGQFIAEIVRRQPGTLVTLKIRRDGQLQSIQAKLVSVDSLRALRASADNERKARQIRALQRKVSLLEQAVRQRGQAQPDALNGNGDNSWYYQTEPDDPNQGIHDYGSRARDGQ